jgi:hypothetical protein
MKSTSENKNLDLPRWFYFLFFALIVVLVVTRIVMPLLPYYQPASIQEISELKIYSANNPIALKMFDLSLTSNPNLTKAQVKELQIRIMEYVEPQKYKQHIAKEEMKRIALQFCIIP